MSSDPLVTKVMNGLSWCCTLRKTAHEIWHKEKKTTCTDTFLPMYTASLAIWFLQHKFPGPSLLSEINVVSIMQGKEVFSACIHSVT